MLSSFLFSKCIFAVFSDFFGALPPALWSDKKCVTIGIWIISIYFIHYSLTKNLLACQTICYVKKLLLSAEHQLRVIATTEYILNIHTQDIPLVPNADKQRN